MTKEIIKIEKLVFGGQGMGVISDGRKVFVWNALPGEKVTINISKKKRDYLEAIADKIVEPSHQRVLPKEVNYLSTSPWQIMTYDAENKYKKEIIQDVFLREKVNLPDFEFVYPNKMYEYRNKMEYSFWGDESGLHLALHRRGSSGKQVVNGCKLAVPALDVAANNLLAELQKINIRASVLKSVIARVSKTGEAVASLFVKDEFFPEIALPLKLKGLKVHYSTHKSPASVITKTLYLKGENTLKDDLLGKKFEYNSDSFFQVNLPIFEQALSVIKTWVGEQSVVDMYGGVGSIGLSVSQNPVIVETDEATATMARRNAINTKAIVINTSSENALEQIITNKLLIVDPPRAGLHQKIISRVLEIRPKTLIYLSCNPATQARDIKLLEGVYNIEFFEGYNFFPRTPHIETLAILKLL